MAEGDGISTNAGQIAEMLLALANDFAAQLKPFNSLIIAETEQKERELYGEKLAALFTTTDAEPGGGELAHITTMSDSPFVTGYEFGIRPHDIVAHHIALRFERNGELLYRHMVHNPGTQGKHLSGELVSTIEAACETYWREGISTILTNASQTE